MQHVTSQYSGGRFVSPLNVLCIKMYTVFIMWHVSVENNALSALFVTVCCQLMILHFLLLLCICPFAHYTCIAYIPRTVQRDKNCVARLGFSTVYVTLCLRYSMYWFPRYNVSFRQHFGVRQGHGQRQAQDHSSDRDQSRGHLSNSDDEGGIARRRVPRRTSSEIASAKIAGRPVPAKVRQDYTVPTRKIIGAGQKLEVRSQLITDLCSCTGAFPALITFK